MRIVVVGTSGSGKTTLARRISAALNLPFVELDAINWQAGWTDLNSRNPEEFLRRTDAATAGARWITDGNYGLVRPMVWSRATHLIWLDYDRAVIMARVVRRSIVRAIDARELWEGTGNRERWRKWFRPSHPIRWAWVTWKRRRAQYEEMLADPAYAHLKVFRLRRPREADALVGSLHD